MFEYISSNTRSSRRSASSANRLIARMGCVAGTRFPGDVVVSNSTCESCSPRMRTADHSRDLLSIPWRGLFQQPARPGAARPGERSPAWHRATPKDPGRRRVPPPYRAVRRGFWCKTAAALLGRSIQHDDHRHSPARQDRVDRSVAPAECSRLQGAPTVRAARSGSSRWGSGRWRPRRGRPGRLGCRWDRGVGRDGRSRWLGRRSG